MQSQVQAGYRNPWAGGVEVMILVGETDLRPSGLVSDRWKQDAPRASGRRLGRRHKSKLNLDDAVETAEIIQLADLLLSSRVLE